MASIWVESLARNFQKALDLMEAAVRDCTDEVWQASMWEVPDPDAAAEVRGPDRTLIADPAERHALVQRHSTPWGVAWHALERLDFILAGGFVPWDIWPPLSELLADGTAAALPAAAGVSGHTGLDILTISTPWSRSDLLAYADYCRQRVVDTLKELTDDKAATPAGSKAEPYASRLTRMPLHVVEHASQIRQFITAAGVKAEPAGASR